MPSRLVISKLKAFLIIDLIFLGAVISAFFYFQDQGLIVVGLEPAKFEFSDLTVNPSEVYPGEAVLISLNATNVGDIEGNETLNLEINDVVKDTQNITLSTGASQVIEFSYIEMVIGNHTVKVGDLAGSFIVKPAPPETSKIILSNLWLFVDLNIDTTLTMIYTIIFFVLNVDEFMI